MAGSNSPHRDAPRRLPAVPAAGSTLVDGRDPGLPMLVRWHGRDRASRDEMQRFRVDSIEPAREVRWCECGKSGGVATCACCRYEQQPRRRMWCGLLRPGIPVHGDTTARDVTDHTAKIVTHVDQPRSIRNGVGRVARRSCTPTPAAIFRHGGREARQRGTWLALMSKDRSDFCRLSVISTTINRI